jgi:hypothetical protein
VHADNTGRLRTPFECVQREVRAQNTGRILFQVFLVFLFPPPRWRRSWGRRRRRGKPAVFAIDALARVYRAPTVLWIATRTFTFSRVRAEREAEARRASFRRVVDDDPSILFQPPSSAVHDEEGRGRLRRRKNSLAFFLSLPLSPHPSSTNKQIESASALRHPNLARLLDVFAEGADLVMVVSYF